MDAGLAAAMVSMQQVLTQQTVALKMVKMQHDLAAQTASMLDQAVQAAPPPGQGQQVDKSA